MQKSQDVRLASQKENSPSNSDKYPFSFSRFAAASGICIKREDIGAGQHEVIVCFEHFVKAYAS
jgi:hypothetical protein